MIPRTACGNSYKSDSTQLKSTTIALLTMKDIDKVMSLVKVLLRSASMLVAVILRMQNDSLVLKNMVKYKKMYKSNKSCPLQDAWFYYFNYRHCLSTNHSNAAIEKEI